MSISETDYISNNDKSFSSNEEKESGQEITITKKDLFKVYLRNFTVQASWSYERMQGLGFAICMSPILKKIYKNEPEKLNESLVRHMDFFNTCPNYGTPPILGIVTALEEKRADPDLIRGVKTGMMGPLAGVGDTMMFAILGPLLFSIPASMALAKNIHGAYIALAITQVLFIVFNLFLKWRLLNLGYSQGSSLATQSSGVLERFTFGAGILGLIVVGSLIGSIINLSTPLAWNFGDYKFELQAVLDTLLPKLFPVLTVAFVYYLLKVWKLSPVKIIGFLFLIFTTLGALGIVK
ncbi:PTS system mannose/fructose/sorbose family transporter subunit IID [Citrobacter enshiensis]|uniref:PTS system mannose/fructose/sorbose family transporter subunit IID n=1 Tax=Citrobacter enshiensis TaxID=2971264 RepID=UPI0023E807AA|nr:PTS system mannose/fructose/sorbose family transporter subunit IID [Citrobacter enshiensis]WET41170.1 PTS system mannose/fructose/sorbose family transporter subunit IID [Citrobacter enshiensis]